MKLSYDQLVKVMEAVGWTVKDFEDERSRQFYEELDRNPPPPATPAFFIDDDGPEPDDFDLDLGDGTSPMDDYFNPDKPDDYWTSYPPESEKD